jgi:hypothetical protein
MLPLVKHETTILAEVQKQMKKLYSTIDYAASTHQKWLQTRRTQVQTFQELESTLYITAPKII